VIIDVSNILKVEGSKLDIDTFVEFGSVEFNGDTFQFSKPVKVTGNIVHIGTTLKLSADVSGAIRTKCYRCAKKLEKEFSFSIQETFTNNAHLTVKEDEDIIYFEGNRLDLSEVIVNNIFINMPMKYLCSQECKGLCPKCGTDLNTNQCNCREEEIDPRLEVLKNFFY